MPLHNTIRAIALSALYIIPIFAVIVINELFFPFITGKAFYFRILVEIAFAGWLILAFADPKYRPKINGLTVSVTALALISLIADLVGVSPIRSIMSNFERMEGWLTILHVWMFFISAVHLFGFGVHGRKYWHRWLNASLAVATVVAIYGVTQLFGWAEIHQGSTRIDATLGNAIYMAVYMLFHGFIATYLLFSEWTKGRSANQVLVWLYGIFIVLSGCLILETQTRGTILGMTGGILLSLFLYAVFAKSSSKKSRMIATGVIVFILLLGGIFWLNRDAKFVQNNDILARMATISWNETKSQARAYVWPMALSGFAERPVLGWGQENFNYVFNSKYDPRMYNQEQWFDRAHNIYLDWMINAGILGILAYLSLYFFAFTSIWRSELTVAEKSILSGLIAGYMIHNVFVFDNIASYIMFFGVLGFLASLSKNKEIKLFESKMFSNDTVEYVVAPIVLVVLVGALYFVNIKTIQANTRLISALRACYLPGSATVESFERALSVGSYTANQEIREQIFSCVPSVVSGSYPESVKTEFRALGLRTIDDHIEAAPDDARTYVLSGTLLNRLAQFEKAEESLVKAHALSPTKQSISYELANALINNGKIDEAVALLKEAYEYEPNNHEAKTNYVIALIRADKEAEARSLFGNDPEIFETERLAQVFLGLEQYDKSLAILKVISEKDPENIDKRVMIAQVEYMAGRVTQAVATMRAIGVDFPEFKDEIEEAIKNIGQ